MNEGMILILLLGLIGCPLILEQIYLERRKSEIKENALDIDANAKLEFINGCVYTEYMSAKEYKQFRKLMKEGKKHE